MFLFSKGYSVEVRLLDYLLSFSNFKIMRHLRS